MKRTLTFIFIATLFFTLFLTPKAFAHELFIEVKEDRQTGELRIDVLWGHIRDFLEVANYEDFELFVRDPGGNVEQLELEGIGVQGRAHLIPQTEGEYVFLANRKAGTYTPGDGITRLSVQMAKTVYHVGDGPETVSQPVDLLLDIVPETSVKNFDIGTFKGNVLLNGSTIAEATVTAYGPKDEILEGTTDSDGAFEFEITSNGQWLLKANIETEESGNVDGGDYELTSRTSTLLIDNTKEAPATTTSTTNANPFTLITILVIGLLLGSALTFMFTKGKK
ncbi:hypothetical protein BKP35_08030 [Anaerobacillus arseniciselenatis]|uniref:DUF4198 domain-containing protein n=1 Tax=Anaerobacillus arseniciselenatis TaxID=85682 RepID=A0A1S2LP35_9BACI|nr:DUF4198 domain-containing protein [Anaerobacillus arseniciselenatis]OIJ14136.1 hypothetical protein BKP35_08030 [Anaerobacillus arseniciselenatis]